MKKRFAIGMLFIPLMGMLPGSAGAPASASGAGGGRGGNKANLVWNYLDAIHEFTLTRQSDGLALVKAKSRGELVYEGLYVSREQREKVPQQLRIALRVACCKSWFPAMRDAEWKPIAEKIETIARLQDQLEMSSTDRLGFPPREGRKLDPANEFGRRTEVLATELYSGVVSDAVLKNVTLRELRTSRVQLQKELVAAQSELFELVNVRENAILVYL